MKLILLFHSKRNVYLKMKMKRKSSYAFKKVSKLCLLKNCLMDVREENPDSP